MDFCGISILQFVSHPPAVMGFDFIVIVPLLPSHCGFSFCLWIWGIFFGEFQCLPVEDCSAVSCDSSALTRGSESTSFYFTILNKSVTGVFPHNVQCLQKPIWTFCDLFNQSSVSPSDFSQDFAIISNAIIDKSINHR